MPAPPNRRIATTRLAAPVLVAPLLAAALLAAPAARAQTPPDPPMVLIPGGAYPLGSDDARPSAKPAHRVTLRAFRIDRYEVTNAQFAAFLNTLDVTARRDVPAGELKSSDVSGPDADRLHGNRSGSPSGSRGAYIEMDDTDARIGIRGGKFVPEPGYADHPAPESTWAGARAYCAWRGARLPTEAEWEAAARGMDGRRYPWGDAAPSSDRAVYARARGATEPVRGMPEGTTPDGIHHLSGNLAEWTSSLVRPYPYRADDGREDPAASGERVTRGGDHVFDVAADQLTGFFRDGFSRDPRNGHRHIGWRCAKDAEES